MDPGPSSSSASQSAPEQPLPKVYFSSIEYPGYVGTSSVPKALQTLGGQASVNAAFKRNANKQDALLELNFRPGNPFSHPIPGDIVPTNNIVLKVVKRKRKKATGAVAEAEPEIIGEYTAEAVGVIPKTARFRSMADFQYQPDMNDPVAKLRLAMDSMDVDAIRAYTIPEEKEDYIVDQDPNAMDIVIDPALTGTEDILQTSSKSSNLRLFPPPLFSRQSVPQNYNFKANPVSVVATSIDEETGEERKRLINKMRWQGYGPASILYVEKEVPKRPPAHCEKVRDQFDQKLLKKLEELFQERPIWTRQALFNQFTPMEARDIHNSKVILPLSCYVFQDGPWRDTMIRFGYDPRLDKEARFYQRLYFRNLNHAIVRPSLVTRRQETRYSLTSINRPLTEEELSERRQSHTFNGVTPSKETAAFQLCDITDPMIKAMVDDPEEVRDVCNERDGWYTTHALERIKTVLRHKFFSLQEGHIATDEECAKLFSTTSEGSKRVHKRVLRPGRHNMAKGALPPEDAAALRLTEALRQKAAQTSTLEKGSADQP